MHSVCMCTAHVHDIAYMCLCVVCACIHMVLHRHLGLISAVILEHCLHLSLETKLNNSTSLAANDSPVSASLHKDGVTVMFHLGKLFT